MSSEKYRYLFKGVSPPLTCSDLKSYLPNFGIKRLVEIIWLVSQNNDRLYRALMGSIGIEVANEDLEKAKHAIDYALDLPEYIKYNKHGYGLILDEMKTTLEHLLASSCNKEFVVHLARYIITRAQKLTENFDDDWDWTSSLEPFEEWLQTIDTKLDNI
jgi:hypothetical protein